MTPLPPPLPHQTRRSRNFIARHWRGEYPFWVSYWVVGILANVATWLSVALLLGLPWFEKAYDPAAVFVAIAGTWLVTAVVTAWQVTGVWRSGGRVMSERRAARRGSFWVTIGCGLVIVGTAGFAWQFVVTGVPQLREAWNIAVLGDPDIPDYAIRSMRGMTEIEISGGIKYGLDRDLRAALETWPAVEVVHLDSPGGRLGEARKVFETIREHGPLTYVPHACESACTIVFLGGRERLLGPSGVLGFHAAFFPGASPADDTQAAFLLSNGIDPAFVRHVIRTPNDDMWFPTPAELEAAGIVTGEVANDRFAMSGLGPDLTPEAVERKLLDEVPWMAALRQADPAASETLIATFRDDYVAGATSAYITHELGAGMTAAANAHLPLSADRTVRAFAGILVDAFRAMIARDPRACYAFGQGDDGPGGSGAEYLGERGVRRLLALYEEALWTSDPGHALAPAAREAARATLETIVADLPVDRPADGEPAPAAEEAFCRARLTAWERIDALGAEGIPVMRLVAENMRDGHSPFGGD